MWKIKPNEPLPLKLPFYIRFDAENIWYIKKSLNNFNAKENENCTL